MSRPFRTELRTFAPSALAPEWESAEHERLEIDLSSEATEVEVLRWLAHPDERVFSALVERVGDGKGVERWTGTHPIDFAERVVRTAAERADKESLAWTPVLDRTYAAMPWIVRGVDGEWTLDGVDSPDARLKRLVPWLEANTSPKPLDALLSFEYPALPGLVARHAGGLSFDQVERLADGNLEVELIGNPRVDGNLFEWLTRRVLRSGRIRSGVDQAVAALAERGEPITERVFRQTFEIPMEKDTRNERDLAFGGPTAYDRARERLAALPQLTTEQLERVTRGARGPGTVWSTIVEHPNATLDLLEAAYATRGHSTQLTVLAVAAEREEFTDAFLPRIVEHGDLDTKLRVADRLSGEEQDALAELVRGETRYTCRRVLEGLEGTLPRRVARGFLEHPHREVRVKAIERLGQLAPEAGPAVRPSR